MLAMMFVDIATTTAKAGPVVETSQIKASGITGAALKPICVRYLVIRP
jgi:hypothetical protein